MNNEQRKLVARTLFSIRKMPPYQTDYVAACRVGKAVSVHSTGPLNDSAEWSLAICLSESALHDAGSIPFTSSTDLF